LNCGACRVIQGGLSECLLYERVASLEDGANERLLVAVNFSERPSEFTVQNGSSRGSVLVSTNPNRRDVVWDPRRVQLGPDEGVLVRLS
jgi:hypothetical protein